MNLDAIGIIEGGGLIISGVAVKAIIDAVVKWNVARHQRTEITPQPLVTQIAPQPQPLDVTLTKDLVRQDDFKLFMANYREDITRIFDRIEKMQKDNADVNTGVARQLGALDGTLQILAENIRSCQAHKGCNK